jgi:hypothetical protein
LKSRALYEDLHEQEQNMDAELNALADKFEYWETETEGGLTEYQNYKMGAKRPGSVGP